MNQGSELMIPMMNEKMNQGACYGIIVPPERRNNGQCKNRRNKTKATYYSC